MKEIALCCLGQKKHKSKWPEICKLGCAMGCLKGHWSTSHGETSGGHISSHALLTVCVCVVLHGWLNCRCPAHPFSGGPVGTTALGRMPTVTQLVLPVGSKAQLVICGLAKPMPNLQSCFHGELEHVISGPNGLVGSVFFVTFQDSSQRYVNYNGDNLDTYSGVWKAT